MRPPRMRDGGSTRWCSPFMGQARTPAGLRAHDLAVKCFGRAHAVSRPRGGLRTGAHGRGRARLKVERRIFLSIECVFTGRDVANVE